MISKTHAALWMETTDICIIGLYIDGVVQACSDTIANSLTLTTALY